MVMATMEALEGRIETLERRLSEWEGQVGFLVPLVRQLHREIVAVREDSQRLENKVDQGYALMSEKFREVERQFREVNREILGIKETLDVLPRAVAEEITRHR
jgi:predicted  nucleic acid-binding Zn-ribbon protein